MKSFIFQARLGKPDFLSDYNKDRFKDELIKNDGKKYRITPITPDVSDEKRGWYWSAIVPFVKEINPAWSSLTNDQVHEILKQEFNGFEAEGVNGKVKKFGMSAVASNVKSEIFDNYILRIAEWVKENYGGMTLPDPEHYKKHSRDSGQMINETELSNIEYPENNLGDPKF